MGDGVADDDGGSEGGDVTSNLRYYSNFLFGKTTIYIVSKPISNKIIYFQTYSVVKLCKNVKKRKIPDIKFFWPPFLKLLTFKFISKKPVEMLNSFQKKTSTLSAPSHSNHEISEAGNGRQQRLTPLPTRSSNICSSNQVGHDLVENNLSFPYVDPHPHASMKLDSVSTRQGCSMKRTEKKTHSGESLVTLYTHEETSSRRVDVVLKLILTPAASNRNTNRKRRQHEVGILQKTSDNNISTAENKKKAHSGESLVTPYTHEETSSSTVDVVLKLTPAASNRNTNRKQQHEVGVGILQTRNKKNISTAEIIGKAGKVTMSLSPGENCASILEGVVVVPMLALKLKKFKKLSDDDVSSSSEKLKQQREEKMKRTLEIIKSKVNTQQDCFMKRSQSEAVTYFGEMANRRGDTSLVGSHTSTYEETS